MNVIKGARKTIKGGRKFINGVGKLGDMAEIIMEPQPNSDDIIVVWDAKKAVDAATNIAKYLRNNGYSVCMMSPSDFKCRKEKFITNKVIIIGHHDLADEGSQNVKLQDMGYGLSYGANLSQCVLTVNHKALKQNEKAAFAAYYLEKARQYGSVFDDYGVPREYGKRDKTKRSQYDLLWIVFVKEFLPEFMEETSKPPPARRFSTGRTTADLSVLLERFREEVPGSSYVTEHYLQEFCKHQREFASCRKLSSMPQAQSEWEVLLKQADWQMMRRVSDNLIFLFNPNGRWMAGGTIEQIISPMLNHIHAQTKISALKENHKLEYGIVFNGGGAKGAFQIGVWKWLDEHGFAEHITGISGASVGALNALLFIHGDYIKAEYLWKSMRSDDLIRPNNQFYQGLKEFLEGKPGKLGLYNKEKLEKIVRENICVEALRSKLAYISLSALTTTNTEKIAAMFTSELQCTDNTIIAAGKALASVSCLEYTLLDEKCIEPVEENVRRVLASAALPGAFLPEEIDGRVYIDGGVQDNSPITPLIEAGYQKIIVVSLSPQKADEQSSSEKCHGDGKTIWRVAPEESLGGILEIDSDLTQARINAGYRAAELFLKDFC